jgi:hypothetical protein
MAKAKTRCSNAVRQTPKNLRSSQTAIFVLPPGCLATPATNKIPTQNAMNIRGNTRWNKELIINHPSAKKVAACRWLTVN